MIESGTHLQGISAADFGLPAHTALRYEQPAIALRPLLSSYAVLDSEPVHPVGTREWMLPTWAQIWIVMTDGPISVGIRNRRYARLSSAILYGVTSRAMPVTSAGGITVCIDVRPTGWARLIGPHAETLCDRIVPLTDVLPEAMVADLVESLHRSDRGRDVQSVVDAVFLRHLPAAHPDEPLIAQIEALLAHESTTDPSEAAAMLGMPLRTMRELSKRYFGFPPKLLMMRARFLKVVTACLLAEKNGGGASAITEFYHDASHLNRDAQRFLGMTLRQFLKLDVPYLRAALRARRLVLGAPTPALDRHPVSLRRTEEGTPSSQPRSAGDSYRPIVAKVPERIEN